MATKLELKSEHRARGPTAGKLASSPASPRPGSPVVPYPSTPLPSHSSISSPRPVISPFSTPQSPKWLLKTSDLSFPTSPHPTHTSIFRLRQSDSGTSSPRILLIPDKPERRHCLEELETVKREVREKSEELARMKGEAGKLGTRVRELEERLEEVEKDREDMRTVLQREKAEMRETLESDIAHLNALLAQQSCLSPPPSDDLFKFILDENAALQAQLQASQRTLQTQLPSLLSSLHAELASIHSDLKAMEQFLTGLKRGSRGVLQTGQRRGRKPGTGWSLLCMEEATGIKQTIRGVQTSISDLYALHSAEICSPQ